MSLLENMLDSTFTVSDKRIEQRYVEASNGVVNLWNP